MHHIKTTELAAWLDTLLAPARFQDYCPNGLQVEGKPTIARIVTGVTASEALLRTAIDMQADAVLIHHGWFWRNEDRRVVGTRRKRLALALANDLNIFAYHLPLDAHPELGNNAQLATRLGLEPDRLVDGTPICCGRDNLVWTGTAPGLTTLGELAERVAQRLGRPPLTVGDPMLPLTRVGWCTGGAQGMFDDAIQAGANVYITGEASESVTHTARENGVGFISAGHHATERYGVKALGETLAKTFGLDVNFVDIDNPV